MEEMNKMKILVVGGCGFLGSNLASYGIKNGYDITIFDNLSRIGAASNLDWLKTIGEVKFIHGDTRNRNDVDNVIKNGQFDAVFHLAGQVAMTTSIADPYKDFQTNTMGTFHVLDAIRRFSPHTVMTFHPPIRYMGTLNNTIIGRLIQGLCVMNGRMDLMRAFLWIFDLRMVVQKALLISICWILQEFMALKQ